MLFQNEAGKFLFANELHPSVKYSSDGKKKMNFRSIVNCNTDDETVKWIYFNTLNVQWMSNELNIFVIFMRVK